MLTGVDCHHQEGKIMTKTIAINIADWHGCKAIGHYARGEFDEYSRHISISDAFRRIAEYVR
jgi:hypothetical protein